MSDLRELLGDDDYEATIDKAVQTAERYFNNANYTHPREGVTRCVIERTIEHVTARILEAVLPDLLAQAWDEGHAAGCADPYKRYNDCGCGPNPYRQEG